jgi:hypothetical protein
MTTVFWSISGEEKTGRFVIPPLNRSNYGSSVKDLHVFIYEQIWALLMSDLSSHTKQAVKLQSFLFLPVGVSQF